MRFALFVYERDFDIAFKNSEVRKLLLINFMNFSSQFRYF